MRDQYESDLVLHQRKFEQVIDDRVSSAKIELVSITDVFDLVEGWSEADEAYWGSPINPSCYKLHGRAYLNSWLVNEEPTDGGIIGTVKPGWEPYDTLLWPTFPEHLFGINRVLLKPPTGTLEITLYEAELSAQAGIIVNFSYLLASAVE